jgi:hypothetical protein
MMQPILAKDEREDSGSDKDMTQEHQDETTEIGDGTGLHNYPDSEPTEDEHYLENYHGKWSN